MPPLFQSSPSEKDPQSSHPRSASGMPASVPPPQLPSHRLSKKPPRLSMGFYKQNHSTCLDSPSTTTRMRQRLSSFLLSSPIIRHSSSRSSISISHKQAVEEEEEELDDDDGITTPPTSASEYRFLSPTALVLDADKPTSSTALSLAELVRRELGTVVEDVDEEIDREWQDRRRVLQHSLLARAAERTTVY